MSAGPVVPGPRLVCDADSAAAPSTATPTPSTRRPWLAIVLFAAVALLAAWEWRRAAALETRVGELSAALATAQGELTARRQQLDAIRTSVDDVRERVAGLASLAAQEPTAPSVSPAETDPAH